MKQSYNGLKSAKKSLEGSLMNPNLNVQTKMFLENKLGEANHWLNRIEKLFRPYGGI